jgi:hypothetical protein
MSAADQLRRQGRDLMRVAFLLAGLVVYLGWKAGAVDRGAARIDSLLDRNDELTNLLRQRETQLSGAIGRIGELTGSPLDPAFDEQSLDQAPALDKQRLDQPPAFDNQVVDEGPSL